MNMRAIIEAVARGETPEGYKKVDLGDGSFMFERIEQERESDSLDAFRRAIHGIIERRTGVDFANLTRGAESVDEAQRQHDMVLEQQRQQEAMFERILKQKTFDLGNAHMCNLPRSVLKVLKMLLEGAGEAAIHNDERGFDEQIDAFNGLMLASGVKINCL